MLGVNEIHDICDHYCIKKYTINGDGSIDVDGDVNLNRCGLTEIPLDFNKVSGLFYCGNNMITSLKGSPREVGKYFYCGGNNLTSLEYCPSIIREILYCNDNPLIFLNKAQIEVGTGFVCTDTKLPEILNELFDNRNDDRDYFAYDYQKTIRIFLKYHNYYDVWTDVFHVDNYHALMAEIKDGLE